METLRASAKRIGPWLPWLATGAAASVIWGAAHPERPLWLLPTTVAAGRAILMLYLAVMWGRWRELRRGALVGAMGVLGWVGARLSLEQVPTAADTLGAAGVALVPFLGYRAWTRDDEPAWMGGAVARLSLAYLFLTPLAVTLAAATMVYLPRAWDAPAYAIDNAVFPIHSFHVGRWLERWPPMRWTAELVYEWIFRLLPALVAIRLRLKTPPATDLLIVCIVGSVLGQVGYYLTPILGPAFAFGDEFPDVAPHIERIPMAPLPVPPFLRNAMPSIHTAWALVFLWNCRPFAWPLRAMGWFVVTFTVIATLGLGQHYVIDLVAAVPYAVVAQTIGTRVAAKRPQEKVVALTVCGALTLLWVAVPHFAWGIASRAPWLVQVVAVGTVSASLLAQQRVGREG